MFWLSLWHGWANSACANSASAHVCSNVQCTYMPQAQVMALWLHWPCAWDRPEKIFPKLPPWRYMEFILSKKFWKIFFRAWKNVCLAGGRATPRVPHPRSQGQLAAVYTMVQSCYCKLGCEPGSSVVLENWILLIGIWICVSRSHFCFFGIAGVRSYNIALFYFKNRNVLTLPLTWLGKFGMCQQCKWTCV